jgi:hypothetical protein
MFIRNSAILAICSITIFSISAMANDISIYRWIDENNVVHFSQQLPQSNNYSQLSTFASYKAQQQSKVNTLTNERLPSVDEQLTEHDKKQAEILEKNKVIAEKNCKAAQLNLKMLNSFNKVTTLDSNGKNHVLTDKEKTAQITLSNKHIDTYCDKKNKVN